MKAWANHVRSTEPKALASIANGALLKVYWLSDGFHRVEAARIVRPGDPIEAEVIQGTQSDAQQRKEAERLRHVCLIVHAPDMLDVIHRATAAIDELLRLAPTNVGSNHAWLDPRAVLDCLADLGAQFLVSFHRFTQAEQLSKLFLGYALSILFMDRRIEHFNGLISAAKLRDLLGDDRTSAILNQIEPTTVTQLILWEEFSQI